MILRGIDRGAVFFAAADYRFFLCCLETKAAEESVSVHAYALMTNHVHVLMTAARDAGVPALMKGVASKTWSVMRQANLARGSRCKFDTKVSAPTRNCSDLDGLNM